MIAKIDGSYGNSCPKSQARMAWRFKLVVASRLMEASRGARGGGGGWVAGQVGLIRPEKCQGGPAPVNLGADALSEMMEVTYLRICKTRPMHSATT